MNENDKRMELTEHLSELRTRLMRCMLYLIAGSILGYVYFGVIFDFLEKPLTKELNHLNQIRAERIVKNPNKSTNDMFILPTPLKPGESVTVNKVNELISTLDWLHKHPGSVNQAGQVFNSITGPFLVKLKLGIIVGFILVTPLLVWEAAMFVTPALTPTEKKPLRFLIPLSVSLLVFGIIIAYITLFFAIGWFTSFLDDFSQTTLLQNPEEYVMFVFAMMASFGIAFQLPVVLMGGAYLNLITAKGLIKNWRWGIVIAALGALFVPSNDIPSMVLIAVPLLILYFGSIVLVKMVEMGREREKRKSAPK